MVGELFSTPSKGGTENLSAYFTISDEVVLEFFIHRTENIQSGIKISQPNQVAFFPDKSYVWGFIIFWEVRLRTFHRPYIYKQVFDTTEFVNSFEQTKLHFYL